MGWVNGYKVLMVHEDELGSASWYPGDCAHLIYSTRKINKPKLGFGPLGVFRDLEQAKLYRRNISWASNIQNYKIFKCKFIPSKQKTFYYKNGHRKIKINLPDLSPRFVTSFEKSSFATQVKLLEEVE